MIDSIGNSVAIRQLVEELITDSMAQSRVIRQLDVEQFNELAQRVGRAKSKILAFGDPGRGALLELMAHKHPGVRLNAATAVLLFDAKAALPVLEALAQGDAVDEAGYAYLALTMWREGDFPPKK